MNSLAVQNCITVKASNERAKAVPLHAMKAFGWRGDSSYSFSTSALDGVSAHRHAPAAKALLSQKNPPSSITDMRVPNIYTWRHICLPYEHVALAAALLFGPSNYTQRK
jgi:hypothetical protein